MYGYRYVTRITVYRRMVGISVTTMIGRVNMDYSHVNCGILGDVVVCSCWCYASRRSCIILSLAGRHRSHLTIDARTLINILRILLDRAWAERLFRRSLSLKNAQRIRILAHQPTIGAYKKKHNRCSADLSVYQWCHRARPTLAILHLLRECDSLSRVYVGFWLKTNRQIMREDINMPL